jgi:hypothetical protein
MQMNNPEKDLDEAAEPFMEQAKEALGDAAGGDNVDNPANPSLGDDGPQRSNGPS